MSSNCLKHTVYFVRHGQCRGNVTGETLPPDEDVITDYGRKQACALGDHLKGIHFTRAYASNYQRARETAKHILDNCGCSDKVHLLEDARIKERELGDFVGLQTKEIVPKIIQSIAAGTKFNDLEIPGGETVAQFVERQRSFFKELCETLKKSEKPETVLIVSHGLLMRRFMVGLNDGTFADDFSVKGWVPKCGFALENTSCTIFTVECLDSKPLITFEEVHCRDHLVKMQAENNHEDKPKGQFNVSDEQKKKFMEQVLKTPGAKEELSGCVQM